MDYIYEIAAFLLLIFFIFVVVVKKHRNKKQNERNIADLKSKAIRKKVITSKFSNNLALGDVKNSGGIISKNIAVEATKEKNCKMG